MSSSLLAEVLRSRGSGTGVDGRSLGLTCLVVDFESFFGRPRFPFFSLDSLGEGRAIGLRPSPIPTVEPTMGWGTWCFHGSFCAIFGCGQGVTGLIGAGLLLGKGPACGPGADTSASIVPIVGSGSWPSRISLQSLRSQDSVWCRLYH